MQDRYVGDVGDFGKLGLLRILCGFGGVPRLNLGVVWYRVDNELHNNDGKHWTYLVCDSRKLRSCDTELYDRLNRLLVKSGKLVGERNMAIIENSGLLEAGTRFFSDSLNYESIKDRLQTRRNWLERALAETVHADIIF